MKKILVTGSAAYDFLLSHEGSFADGIASQQLSSLSVAFLAQHMVRHHGGTGANIAWNLNLLEEQPMLITTVGKDGGEYRTLLEERGLDVSYVEKKEEAMTATAIVATDSEERQITFFHPGADQHGTWPELQEGHEELACGIVSPRDVQLMIRAAEWCSKSGTPYYFDPGQQLLALSSDELSRLVRGSAGVIVNEYEWGLLQERIRCTEENILMQTPLLIVTRGEHGTTFFDADGARNIAPCPAQHVVNPTGAGDAFRAGFLAGVRRGWNTVDCVRLGSALGSFAVEEAGTLLDSLDREQLWLRAERAYREKLPELNS